MNPLSWITRIWEAIPNGLKKFVGYGVASGIALAIVLAGYLFWGSDAVQQRLARMKLASKDDISKQTETLETAGTNAMDALLMRYDSTLHAYLDLERKFATDTILVPLLEAVRTLDLRQREMLREQRAGNNGLDQLSKAYDERLERLMQQNDPQAMERALAEVMGKLERQDAMIRELRDTDKRNKRKSSKQEF